MELFHRVNFLRKTHSCLYFVNNFMLKTLNDIIGCSEINTKTDEMMKG